MAWWQAVLLGILQGATEFLPISSSGHLALLQHFFALPLSPRAMLAFDIVIHVGTLGSIFCFYHRELRTLIVQAVALRDPIVRREAWQFISLLVAGTIPAVIAGLLFKDFFAEQFEDMLSLAIFFFVTGIVLLSTRWIVKIRGSSHSKGGLTLGKSLIIGVSQAIAILPSVSRSATTIAAGLWTHLSPALAARFSFFLAIPAIVGALVLSLGDLSLGELGILELALGFASSFVVGYFSIGFCLRVLERGKLHLFATYCFVLAAFTTLLVFL